VTYTPGCWFAQNVIGCGPCDGRLVRCHLIPKQLLKREAASRHRVSGANDERVWVWGCGGPMGNGGHHGQLDHSRTLRIHRDVLPPGLEEFAREWNLEWWLDREYGPRKQAA
jgi:hypothetical protein